MSFFDWGLFEALLTALAVTALIFYWLGVLRLRAGGRHWSLLRAASFSAGVLLLIAALLPQVTDFAHHDLRGHMTQHLLMGMVAPLGLVLGAPVTLALRAGPRPVARALAALLRTRFVTSISHPLSALALNLGGMYLLYLTPLYLAMHHSALLHALVHWHFLAAGCLFTWAIAGPDPAPHRPRHRYRLMVLAASMAGHAFLAKAMYAYGWPADSGHSLAEIHSAAKIMYYGGDAAELLLLIALFADWFARPDGASKQRGGRPPQRRSADSTALV